MTRQKLIGWVLIAMAVAYIAYFLRVRLFEPGPVVEKKEWVQLIGSVVVFMLGTTLVVIAMRHQIPYLFLGDDSTSPATANSAATLLLIGASFFVTDALQGVAGGALRGLNDTRVPMLFAALSFWVIGFPGAYMLAFPAGLGAIGIWIGFSLSVATFAVLLVWRFERLSLHGEMPSLPE